MSTMSASAASGPSGGTRRMGARLVDGRSPPSTREWITRLLSHAEAADFAIARLRFHALDLSAAELTALGRCRVLLRRLDHGMVAGAPGTAVIERPRRKSMEALVSVLREGRVEVRSAGPGDWEPDFSVYHGRALGPEGVALVGPHLFGGPAPSRETLACVLAHGAEVERAHRVFERLWSDGYDVAAVLIDTLERVLGEAPRR